MIAPRIISHVQPTGRDYSANQAPGLITHVPSPEEARKWVEDRDRWRRAAYRGVSLLPKLGPNGRRISTLTGV